jgi:deoxycytidylate deaminase
MVGANLAKKASFEGQHHQYLVGACIVRSGHVLSIGYNKNKTHPMMGKFRHLHAEVDALLKVKDRDTLRGSDIYVTRQNKNGRVGLAKPCSTCMGHLRSFGVRNVYYTGSNGEIQKLTIE